MLLYRERHWPQAARCSAIHSFPCLLPPVMCSGKKKRHQKRYVPQWKGSTDVKSPAVHAKPPWSFFPPFPMAHDPITAQPGSVSPCPFLYLTLLYSSFFYFPYSKTSPSISDSFRGWCSPSTQNQAFGFALRILP